MHPPSLLLFPQNLYFYASENNEEFRRHMLVETLLIPRLVLPYLDRCVLHATILNRSAPRPLLPLPTPLFVLSQFSPSARPPFPSTGPPLALSMLP